MSTRTESILAAMVLALHIAAAPTLAVTFDAAADFDASLAPEGPGGTNPNGVWTYGETVGLLGALLPFPDLAETAEVNCSAENMWLDLSTHVGFTPSVAKSIAACFDGNVAFDAGQLILHGGGIPDRYAHVVFTAPSDLECLVDATFIARQNEVSADVHILTDGAAIFSDVLIGGPGTLTNHNAVLTFIAGDTVSFAVGLGAPPQDLHPGNVELQAVLDCVPQACLAPPSGLTGWWPGDGNTEDIVGGRDAVLRDDAAFSSGLVDQAFILDGDGDFVEVAHDPALNVGTGDFTIDLWVNFNTTAGEQVLIEKYVENFGETPPGWVLTKLDDNSLRFGTGPASAGHGVTSPPLSLPANTWIHVAARRSSGVASIFVNGVEVATAPFVDNADSDSSLKFGHRGSPDDTPGSTDTRGFFLNGRIDEVELFVGRALSDTEIQAIFNAGSAGKCKEPDTVVIDGCNTGVPNTSLSSGSTISDFIATCAAGARNHGQFVSCVAHVTNDLKKAGTITGRQKRSIQSCATQANIP